MSHDQELHGVHIQDPRRCGQDDGADPYESTADPLDHDHQGHEQETLPQARRGDRLARQAAHVGPLSLLHGADGTTQARSADEARNTDAEYAIGPSAPDTAFRSRPWKSPIPSRRG